jgi:aerobic carbon-monoxide dehydrogenase large subunit
MDGGTTRTGIGQPVRRREDLRLLTGKGRYSDDLNLPDQAYAVMVRSPYAHALIRGIDTAAARAAPGVLAVLTADDVRADGLNPLPNIANNHPADISIRNKDGSPTVRPEQAAIVGPEICHVGEIVAAVVATSLAAAKDAAELVAMDYQALPAVSHSLNAAAPDAPRARRDSANIILDGEVGDPVATEAAFAAAAHVVRFETWVQRIAGVPMEPRAAVGEYDPPNGQETGRYTLHAGAGGAVSPRRDLAMVLGVPPEGARVVMHDVGGNFGTRGGFNPEFAIVTWAARRVGRPVKWTSERHEYFSADHQARDLAVTAELALDKDGIFLAMRGSNLVNQGAYALAFGSLNKGVEIMSSIYHVPAVSIRARAALTNTAPTRPYRSSGRGRPGSTASNCAAATSCRNR